MNPGYDSLCCFRSPKPGIKRRLLWELTRQCNWHCPFCHIHHHGPARWTSHKALGAVEQIVSIGVDEVILSGGEPLMVSFLFDLLAALTAHGLKTDVCTNGALLTPQKAQSLRSYIDEISISIHGASATEHDTKIKTPGAWKSTMRGLAFALDVGLEVHVVTVIDSTNLHRLPELARFVESLGAHSITFIGLMPYKTTVNALATDRVQGVLRQGVEAARTACSRLIVNTKRLLWQPAPAACEAGRTILGLDAAGRLCPCILMAELGRPLEDGCTPDSLNALASSLTSLCDPCGQKDACLRGCPASVWMQTGLMGCDMLCGDLAIPN
jgi:MoaA/NifB/PqqE/SkfB family radical SAM enzyme